jgi:hypothetical protein
MDLHNTLNPRTLRMFKTKIYSTNLVVPFCGSSSYLYSFTQSIGVCSCCELFNPYFLYLINIVIWLLDSPRYARLVSKNGSVLPSHHSNIRDSRLQHFDTAENFVLGSRTTREVPLEIPSTHEAIYFSSWSRNP